MRTINIVILCILCILCILFIYRFINYNRITNLISLTPHNIDSTNNTSAAVYKFDELYNTTAARGPNDPRVAEQYPQLADQLLLNSAESYPVLCGNITAPIRQDNTIL